MNSHYQSLLRKLTLPIFYLFFLSSTGWALDAEKLNVEVTGVTGDVLKNVEIWLSISNAAEEQKVGLLESFNIGEKNHKPELSEPTIQRLHRLAPEEIRQAMQPFGYYEPKIDARIKKVMDVWQAASIMNPKLMHELQRSWTFGRLLTRLTLGLLLFWIASKSA